MQFSKELDWGSHTGKVEKIKNLEDTHIANLLWFLQNTIHPCNDVSFLFGLRNYALNERGLTQEFLDDAPHPYWDEEGNEYSTNINNGQVTINSSVGGVIHLH